MTTARFITLEGGEGVGKSTQLKALAAALRARGLDEARHARGPGDVAREHARDPVVVEALEVLAASDALGLGEVGDIASAEHRLDVREVGADAGPVLVAGGGRATEGGLEARVAEDGVHRAVVGRRGRRIGRARAGGERGCEGK